MSKQFKQLTRRGNTKTGVIVALSVTIVVILILYGTGLVKQPGCTGGCCVNVNENVADDFGLEIDGAKNDSFFVSEMFVYVISIDPVMYDIIMDNDLQTEAELIAYMDANYPGAAIPIYLVETYIGMVGARYFADSDYDNMSLDGKSKSACAAGIAVIPYLEFTVCYENGTVYDYFDAYAFDMDDMVNFTVGDIVNMTYNMPLKYVTLCGGTYSIEVVKLTEDTGEDPFVTLLINGEEVEAPIY
jgi:hypothetical protein